MASAPGSKECRIVSLPGSLPGKTGSCRRTDRESAAAKATTAAEQKRLQALRNKQATWSTKRQALLSSSLKGVDEKERRVRVFEAKLKHFGLTLDGKEVAK